MTYISGEPLDLSGLVVMLIFDEGSPENVAYSNFGAYNITTVPAHDTPLTSADNGQPITVNASGRSENTTSYLKVIEPIATAAVTVTPPAKNAAPSTAATSSGHFIVGAVSWSPNHNTFQSDTAYTATVTLTANTDYTFTGLSSATINGGGASISNNTGTTVTLSYTFAKTPVKEITGITVKLPPTKMAYTNVETLDLSGLVVTLHFDDTTTEDVVFADFVAKGITTSPTQGTALNLTHNGTSVAVTTANEKTTNTGNLTVSKAGASAVTFPSASAITYGEALSSSTLSGGSAGRGTFAWVNGTTVPSAGTHSYDVEFTPNDEGTYDYSSVPNWNGVTNKVVRSVSITVNQKYITITPTAGQSKVYGTADPAFTYTPSEALLPGNSFTGTLAYTGTNVGTYPFTQGSLSAGGNYNLTLAGSVTFAITRAPGSVVTKPSGTWNFSTKTINVTAVSLSTATGQDIEYAISTSGSASAASLTWTVNKLTFDITAIDTTYFIYARSRESPNYSAGTANVSEGINTPSIPSSIISPTTGIEMVSIPAGTFTMGSPNGEKDSQSEEHPPHSVTLNSFYMSKYQVTQAQYQAVMGTNPSNFYSNPQTGENQSKRPVESVSWYQALVFCNVLSVTDGLTPVYSIDGSTNVADWGLAPTSDNPKWNAVQIVDGSTGYRLPTEAQWEYACRAGTTTAYNTGATISDKTGWYSSNSKDEPWPVSGHENAWGLYDMHGNVYEWCWDWYDSYPSNAQTDPMGASSGTNRVVRGGCYSNTPERLRSAYRGYTIPSNRYDILGFRLARP